MRNRVLVVFQTIFFVFLLAFTPFAKGESNIVPVTTSRLSSISEGKAECVMELHSRRVLYAKNADTALPMASTTKIVTAAVVLEHCNDLQDVVTIPKAAEGVEGSSVYLKCGDQYTVEDLLYGLLLRSGNDCAVALALYVAHDAPAFSLEMLRFAQKAGAMHSRFQNPHGLPQAGHYTTARDLSLISALAYQNPVFKQIVGTRYYEKRQWKNKNKLLTLYDGGCGIKTGYTKQAGRCLVSAAVRKDMTLVCTLLNCPTTYERTMQLFDDAFSAYHNQTLLKKDDILTVREGNREWQGRADATYTYPLLKEEENWIEIKTFPLSSHTPSSNGEKIVGKFEIYIAKDLLFSGNLYKL